MFIDQTTTTLLRICVLSLLCLNMELEAFIFLWLYYVCLILKMHKMGDIHYFNYKWLLIPKVIFTSFKTKK